MLLHVNAEQREVPDGMTVAALVAQLGMKPDRVAVELNLEIVPRSQWETTRLKDGDKLEVVHFVGGGRDHGSLEANTVEGSESPVSAGWQCPTCGTLVQGKFCPDCGEKKFGAADLSMRHFFTHALGEFFHFDSKIFRSFRLLFARPGFLTAEYLRGCRKPYLHPFQLFFVANLIYFLAQPYTGWSGLRTTLGVQMHQMSYSNFAVSLVARRIAARGITLEQFAASFDHVIDVQARTLVVLMVLMYAILLSLLQWRKHRFFGEHLVFSLHFTAFWLIAVFLLLYGGSTIVFRTLALFGVVVLHGRRDWLLFPVALAAIAVYAFLALRAVYRESVLSASIKSLVIAAAFHYVLDTYRFILFLTALWSS